MEEKGTCGKNLTWHHVRYRKSLAYYGYDLIISGNGEMYNYDIRRSAPWREDIRKVSIKHGVTTIGKWAFSGCHYLESITIPNSVTEIGNGAFYECRWLKEITIPDGVTEIGSRAFCDCKSLKEITIPDGVTTIGEYAFGYCESLTEIKFPDRLTRIDYCAFFECTGLVEIKIPASVTEIGSRAFCDCKSLKEITIPDSVTKIGDNAFCDCKSLKEITIPYELKKLGEEVLDGCTSLEKIYYRADSGFESKLEEGNNAQLIPLMSKNVKWQVEEITLTVGSADEIKDYSKETPPWHDYLKTIQRIVIEDGVKKISANAFSNVLRLEHVTIPASVKTIGDFAFTISYCGERTIDGGKNVLWSLTDGKLIIKKNPAAKSDADFSTGYETWNVIEKNIAGVEIERGVIPSKNFFEWLARMGNDIKVSF